MNAAQPLVVEGRMGGKYIAICLWLRISQRGVVRTIARRSQGDENKPKRRRAPHQSRE